MELYPLLFSSCRIPGPKHDLMAHYGRPRHSPTHITVVRNYQVGSPARASRSHSAFFALTQSGWVLCSHTFFFCCFCRSYFYFFSPTSPSKQVVGHVTVAQRRPDQS